MKLKDILQVTDNVIKSNVSLLEIKSKLASYPSEMTSEQSSERQVYAIAHDFLSLIKGFGLNYRDRSYREMVREINNS